MITPLNPAASPVDAFAPSEVRASTDGMAFARLAESLSRFEPSLTNFGAVYWQRRRADALAENTAAVTKLRIQNRKDFDEAVSRGQIPRADNPHFIEDIKTEVAKTEAVGAMQGFRAWYESAEGAAVRSSDDPRVVENSLNERLGPLLQELSPQETMAVLPEYERFSQALVANHLTRRSSEREGERALSFSGAVRSAVSQVDPEELEDDYNGPRMLPSVASGLQAQADNARLTLDPRQVAAQTIDGVIEQAELAGDIRIAEQLLGELNVDGTNLKTLAGDKLLAAAERIDYRRGRAEAENVRAEKALIEQQSLQAVNAAIQGNINFADPVQSRQFFSSLPLPIRLEAAATISKLYGDERQLSSGIQSTNAEEAIRKMSEAVLLNLPNKESAVMTAFMLDAENAGQAYGAIKRSRDQWPDTTPIATNIERAERILNGTLSLDWLVGKANANEYSASDFEEDVKRLYALRESTVDPEKHRSRVANLATGLEDQIIAGLVDNKGLSWDDLKGTYADPESRELVASAIAEFEQRATDLVLQYGPTTPPGELDKALKELRDTIAVDRGGYTYQERLKAVQSRGPEATYKSRLAEGAVYSWGDDPLFGAPRYKVNRSPGGFFTIQGENYQPRHVIELPRLFSSAKDYQDNYQAVMRHLGLTAEEAAQFARLQKEYLKAENTTKKSE